MATLQKFEDLKLWQKARDLSQNIYPLTFVEPICSDYRFKDQLRGSRGSIMDNIAEGFERGSKLAFINSLTISKGEAGELKSQQLFHLADEVTKMITGLINYLNKFKIKGQKYKDRT